MSYKICPNCGAALDPGERCDCQDSPESQTPENPGKKEAAPVLQHQSGKVESESPNPHSASDSIK